MKINFGRNTIFVIAIVIAITGYSIWVNLVNDTIPRGDSYTCTDSLTGDKYTINVSGIEYAVGTMTVGLLVDYNSKDAAEGRNTAKSETAVKVFLQLNSHLESNGVTYRPDNISTEVQPDIGAMVFTDISFFVDDDKQYIFVVGSGQKEIKFALK